MHIPYFIQGLFFGPALILLTLLLKLTCPQSAGAGCFADHLATPVFFPLIFIYKISGESFVISHDFWFILFYWAITGLLIGLIFDLRTRRSQYSPVEHPPL